MRILVIGGYGTFGSRLVRLLADDRRLTLFVAWHSVDQAAACCAALAGEAKMLPLAFDRNGDVHAQLRQLKPDLIVDASGPFQAYGDDPYRVVKAALVLGADYLDLADGAEFVG